MSAEVYDLNLFRERIDPCRKLGLLAFVEREIRRIGTRLTGNALELTGLPYQSKSLTEYLLALPDRKADTSPEWQLITELKRLDRLRNTDRMAYLLGYVLWIDQLLAHHGYEEFARGAKAPA